MRKHLWMHGGLAVGMLGVLGLGALGVAVPIGVIYAVLLACPLMMASMMLGGHDHAERDHSPKPDLTGRMPSSATPARHAERSNEPA